MGLQLNLNELLEKLSISSRTLKILFWAFTICIFLAFGLWGATSIKNLITPNIITKYDTIKQINIRDTCISREKIIGRKNDTIEILIKRLQRKNESIDSIVLQRNKYLQYFNEPAQFKNWLDGKL